jgi:hypothetical protein
VSPELRRQIENGELDIEPDREPGPEPEEEPVPVGGGGGRAERYRR